MWRRCLWWIIGRIRRRGFKDWGDFKDWKDRKDFKDWGDWGDWGDWWGFYYTEIRGGVTEIHGEDF